MSRRNLIIRFPAYDALYVGKVQAAHPPSSRQVRNGINIKDRRYIETPVIDLRDTAAHSEAFTRATTIARDKLGPYEITIGDPFLWLNNSEAKGTVT